MGFEEALRGGLKELGVALEPGTERLFILYYKILAKEAAVLNLTGITAPMEVATKHFVDSLVLLKWVSFTPGECVLDVGSGAGFPGMPLGIAARGLRVVLLEAVKKKAEFQRKVVESLGLKNIEVVWGRAEEYGRLDNYRERFDWVTARAVAPLRELAEYMLPFVRVGGRCIAFKGPKGREEMAEAVSSVGVLGGRIEAVREYRLPLTGDGRLLIFVMKERRTPAGYPRRPGIPRKRPL
ncbi:MAG TPA: 16S rRNA (guanine(527)-N(7))-methyltransferase RsmG [Desulfotomaculum sp.]|nr:16S rRNA (guanine(527)-N(7))-methyltransferase RsmG [Desulfotomaculum sp.]